MHAIVYDINSILCRKITDTQLKRSFNTNIFGTIITALPCTRAYLVKTDNARFTDNIGAN